MTGVHLGGPITCISPEKGAALDKNPDDDMREADLWKRKALGEQ